MIEPIQNTVSFKGLKEFQAQTAKRSEVAKENKSVSEVNKSIENVTPEQKPVSVKEGIANVLKGFNKVTNTTSGLIRGIFEGAVLVGATGFVGRNIKNAEGNIGKTITGMFKDLGKIATTIIKHRPIRNIFTKAPVENLKTLHKLPKYFYNKCLKGNKATAAIAALLFVGAVTVRTIQGKMSGNKASAEIDHNFGIKH